MNVLVAVSVHLLIDFIQKTALGPQVQLISKLRQGRNTTALRLTPQ